MHAELPADDQPPGPLSAALALEYAPFWQACLGMHSAIRRAAEEAA